MSYISTNCYYWKEPQKSRKNYPHATYTKKYLLNDQGLSQKNSLRAVYKCGFWRLTGRDRDLHFYCISKQFVGTLPSKSNSCMGNIKCERAVPALREVITQSWRECPRACAPPGHYRSLHSSWPEGVRKGFTRGDLSKGHSGSSDSSITLKRLHKRRRPSSLGAFCPKLRSQESLSPRTRFHPLLPICDPSAPL